MSRARIHHVADGMSDFKVLRVPTNAGWASDNLGSGGNAMGPFNLTNYTGTTASSRGMLRSSAYGLNSGNMARPYCDWDNRLELNFIVCRWNSDAEAVARVQLKESYSEGQLAQRGIGIQVNNYSMYGESYGTVRGTVSLASLTDNRTKRVKIVLRSGAVDFYVDGVLAGTLTGDAVPSGAGGADCVLVASIINGSTGGVNAYMMVGDIMIVQEW
jgi:hypothetical protein